MINVKQAPLYKTKAWLNTTWSAHLDSPKITWQQEDDGDHAGNEATTEDVTEQVDQDGAWSEEEVEEWGQRMSETQFVILFCS